MSGTGGHVAKYRAAHSRNTPGVSAATILTETSNGEESSVDPKNIENVPSSYIPNLCVVLTYATKVHFLFRI